MPFLRNDTHFLVMYSIATVNLKTNADNYQEIISKSLRIFSVSSNMYSIESRSCLDTAIER